VALSEIWFHKTAGPSLLSETGRAVCSNFRFPLPTRTIHSIYNEHNFMFYKTEDEGFSCGQVPMYQKNLLPESSTQSTSVRDFYSENVCIKFLLNVGIHLSTTLK
jgi:hypothetical protein